MNDRQLRYAHAVWRERSFSKAGEKLGVSQPSLSDQIRLLETELGFELFVRSSRGVDPSANGRIFLEEVDDFVGSFADLKLLAHELHGKPGTRVRIGLGYGTIEALSPLIATVLCNKSRHIYPDISTGTTRRILRLLHQQRLDIGVIFQSGAAPLRQTLSLETIAEEEIVALVPPGDPLAKAGEIAPQDIARQRILVSEPRIGYGRAVLSHFAQSGFTPEIAAYCDDTDALKYMMAAGAGIAFLPRLAVAHELAAGSLKALSLNPPLKVAIQLARRREKFPERLEKAVTQLTDAITYQLGANDQKT
jgi:DNA-binding transcriptional LysR family regulator